MSQINSNIKDDFQVVLLPSCFVGHPVYTTIKWFWITLCKEPPFHGILKKPEILPKFKFLIPISLQPDGINLWYFKLFDLTYFIFQRLTAHLIRKSEFVAKTQFLFFAWKWELNIKELHFCHKLWFLNVLNIKGYRDYNFTKILVCGKISVFLCYFRNKYIILFLLSEFIILLHILASIRNRIHFWFRF